MIPETAPFSFFHQRFNILFVDDEPDIINPCLDILRHIPLFKIHLTNTVAAAVDVIESQERWHLLAFDLGMHTPEDEFYLLRRYARKIPSIVCSASVVAQKYKDCFDFGALDVIQKGTQDITHQQLLQRMCRLVVTNCLNPAFCRQVPGNMNDWTEILQKTVPESVAGWARLCTCSEKSLFHLWKKHCKIQTSEIVNLNHILYGAFNFFLLENFAGQFAEPEAPVWKHEKIYSEYWQKNSFWDKYLFTNWPLIHTP